MKNYLILFAVILSVYAINPAAAQTGTKICVDGTNSYNGGNSCTPVTATNPFPVTVAGGSGETVTANQGTANAGGAAAWPVQGAGASGAAAVGNTLRDGGVNNTTPPTLSDGKQGDLQLGTTGSLHVELWGANSTQATNLQSAGADGVVNSGPVAGPNVYSRPSLFNGSTWDRQFTCSSSAAVSVTAGNTTQIVALSGTTVIRVCSIIGSISLAGTMTVSYGTGTNCGTGNTALTGTMALATGTPVNLSNGMGSVVRSAAGNAICIAAATGNFTGVLTYAQF